MDHEQTWKQSHIQYIEPEELPSTIRHLYVNKQEDLIDLSSGHLKVIRNARSSIVSVSIQTMRTSQPVVNLDSVQAIVESGTIQHPPCLATEDGKLFYVLEGNHRINAEIQQGKEEVLCKVFYI